MVTTLGGYHCKLFFFNKKVQRVLHVSSVYEIYIYIYIRNPGSEHGVENMIGPVCYLVIFWSGGSLLRDMIRNSYHT